MKIRTSILAKGLAWLLIAISGLGLVGSGLLAIGMEQAEFYDKTYQEVREERFATFNDRYSARVLAYLYAEKDTNLEYFADKNFKYGVIEADFIEDIQNLNLNDRENYVESNFDFEETLLLEDMHVFQCTINENTYFSYKNPESLWGHYWISNTSDRWNSYEVAEFVYDVERGIFFAKAGGQYYPLPKIIMNIHDKNGNITEQGFAFDAEKAAYTLVDNVYTEFGEQQYDAQLEIEVRPEVGTQEVLVTLNELHEAADKGGLNFLWLDGTVLDMEKWRGLSFSTYQEVYPVTESPVDAGDVKVLEETENSAEGSYNMSLIDVELSYEAVEEHTFLASLEKEVRMVGDEYGAVLLNLLI